MFGNYKTKILSILGVSSDKYVGRKLSISGSIVGAYMPLPPHKIGLTRNTNQSVVIKALTSFDKYLLNKTCMQYDN